MYRRYQAAFEFAGPPAPAAAGPGARVWWARVGVAMGRVQAGQARGERGLALTSAALVLTSAALAHAGAALVGAAPAGAFWSPRRNFYGHGRRGARAAGPGPVGPRPATGRHAAQRQPGDARR